MRTISERAYQKAHEETMRASGGAYLRPWFDADTYRDERYDFWCRRLRELQAKGLTLEVAR